MEKSALFPNNTRRKHKSLSQSLAENITEKIRSGALKPGDKLPTESAIMELYEVSRTVVGKQFPTYRPEA
jgi:GntR family transcriptional repressor for pyruvate dehydrogenase complex